MSRPIEVIFFDAADTLFHVNGSVAELYLRYAREFGYQERPDSVASITEAFRRAFRDAPPPVFAARDPAQLKDSERLWWFDVVHNVFYRIGMFERFDEFFDRVFDVFAEPASWKLYPDTVPALAALRRRGIELGIVSNFDSRLFAVLRGLEIAEFFDTITISSLARAAKPSPKIFELALEKHAVDPDDAVHVGDSMKDDVEGATQAGLRAIWLAREEKPPADGILTIRTLAELVPLAAAL